MVVSHGNLGIACYTASSQQKPGFEYKDFEWHAKKFGINTDRKIKGECRVDLIRQNWRHRGQVGGCCRVSDEMQDESSNEQRTESMKWTGERQS